MWGFLGLVVFVSLVNPLQGVPKDTSPAVVSVFSPEALRRYVITTLLHNDMLQNYILAIRIPDIPSKAPAEHWITNMYVLRVFLPHVNLELQETGSAMLIIKARLHFSAKGHFGKHVERFDFIVDLDMVIGFRFVNYFNGLIEVKVESCKTDFKIAKIILPSHLQSHTVRPVVASVLSDTLQGLVCHVVEVLLKFVKTDLLSTINVILPMGKVATIEYRLASVPLISAHVFTVEKHMFIRIGSRTIAPPPRSIVYPVPSLKDNALCFGMTEPCADTVLSVLLQMGALEFMVTPQIFSAAEELTTAVSALFAHGKCPKCPVKSPLKITITVVGDKRLVIEPKKATLKITIEITFYSKGPTGAFSNLFTLKVNIRLTTQASVHDCFLYFVTKMLSVEVLLLHSDVGPIDIAPLEKWMQLLLEEAFVPQVNDLLQVGFPLPSPLDIQLNYPYIHWMLGMLVICA
ncbi:BPI fold-containing family B member 4-like [Anolis sagrei]|uniref:BPI fold-containing family B member 4-like n=1 Tax=Anolis sagrei TaxID=38937 RepID=UPI0035224A54